MEIDTGCNFFYEFSLRYLKTAKKCKYVNPINQIYPVITTP